MNCEKSQVNAKIVDLAIFPIFRKHTKNGKFRSCVQTWKEVEKRAETWLCAQEDVGIKDTGQQN